MFIELPTAWGRPCGDMTEAFCDMTEKALFLALSTLHATDELSWRFSTVIKYSFTHGGQELTRRDVSCQCHTGRQTIRRKSSSLIHPVGAHLELNYVLPFGRCHHPDWQGSTVLKIFLLWASPLKFWPSTSPCQHVMGVKPLYVLSRP